MPLPLLIPSTLPNNQTVSSYYPAIIRLLMGRTVSFDTMAEAVRKSILELAENYKFDDLQETGPVYSLTPYQASYPPLLFMQPVPSPANMNNQILQKFNSFFIYLNPFVTPSSGTPGGNTGYNLKFRTIDAIETLMNIPGVPIYWSRHNLQIWFASIPDRAYNVYARYQREHPFPNAGVTSTAPPPTAGDDVIYMPRSWQDIIEYSSAMRCAQELNLSTKVTEFHTRLYGDSQFQKTAGLEGQPGLIFQRTSQENRDQTTSRKSFRLKMGRV